MVRGNLGDISAGKPNRQKAGFGVAGPKGRFENVAPNRVINDIRPAQLKNPCTQVFAGIDQMVRTGG